MKRSEMSFFSVEIRKMKHPGNFKRLCITQEKTENRIQELIKNQRSILSAENNITQVKLKTLTKHQNPDTSNGKGNMEQLAETCRQSGKLLETIGRTRKANESETVTGDAGKSLNLRKNEQSLFSVAYQAKVWRQDRKIL